jgi:Family of unknown function (DUF6263)
MRTYAKYSHVVLALAAIASLAATASRLPAAEEKLRWKFAVGEKLDYTMVQDMNMSVTGEKVGQLNSTMRQEMNMTWDVLGVDEKTGDAVIKQKFDQIKMKVSSPIGNFDYDSKSEAVPTGLAAMIAPMYKAMTKGEFEITMTARGEVTDVKIPEDVIAALKAAPGAAALGDITTETGFKEMIRKGALVLPEVAPKEGDTWSTQVAMNNQAGKQIVKTIYKYVGTKEIDGVEYAVIKPELKMEFDTSAAATSEAPASKDPATPAEAPQAPKQEKMAMKIAEQSSDGEVLFNIDKGRLYSTTLQQKVTIDASVAGQAVQQKIDQKIDVKVTSAGENKAAAETKPEATETKAEPSEEKK